MTYKINKTNGDELPAILDGKIDTTSTDLALIGKNAINFGEVLNENFVHLLENFSSASQPAKAIKGQLWYDSATETLNVFNGTEFKNAIGSARSTVSGSTFSGLAPGEFGFITITGAKGYVLYKGSSTHTSTIKVYASEATRALNGSEGLIYSFTTTGSQTKLITPGVVGFNGDTVTSSNIYVTVMNTGTTYESKITVSLTILKIE